VVRVSYAFTAACTACGACLLTCPEHAIVVPGSGRGLPLRVREDRCTSCGECVEVCPADAVVELRAPAVPAAGGPGRPAPAVPA
jgi:ferredoxin